MTRSSVHIQEDPLHDDSSSSTPRTSRSSRAHSTVSPFSSSDKENSSSAKPDKGTTNGKDGRNGNARLAELNPSQRLHNRILEEEADKESYDPDQDPEERRRVKKEYRTLHRKLQDSKQEYLQPNSTGIKDTFLQAEELFKNVKQTSDATLDSRLLVAAADLTLKKATNLTFGKGGISIDTDEFVGKCMTFMKNRGGQARQRAQDDEDDEPDDDDLDWALLGREAAFKGNKRPATTDFLLGPMSVTKRVRLMKQRRQGLKRGNATMVRPVEIENTAEDKGTENTANTSLRLVRSIHTVLEEYFAEHPDLSTTGLNLFKAVINPTSFGQTIENIFYISFLVKDGFIAIEEDDDDLPFLFMADPAGAEDRQTMTVNRNQVIFPMTMHHWQQAIQIFDIDTPIIPTREVQSELVGATGWYS